MVLIGDQFTLSFAKNSRFSNSILFSQITNGRQYGAEIGNEFTPFIAKNSHRLLRISQMARQAIDSKPKTSDRMFSCGVFFPIYKRNCRRLSDIEKGTVCEVARCENRYLRKSADRIAQIIKCLFRSSD